MTMYPPVKFAGGPPAFAHAKHRARYSHRSHLVWTDAAGQWFAGRECLESVEAAAATVPAVGRFWSVGADGVIVRVGPNLARIMVSNWRNGYGGEG